MMDSEELVKDSNRSLINFCFDDFYNNYRLIVLLMTFAYIKIYLDDHFYFSRMTFKINE